MKNRPGYLNSESQYTGVTKYITEGGEYRFLAQLGDKQKTFKHERDAARFVDILLIEQGKDPVNILKRK